MRTKIKKPENVTKKVKRPQKGKFSQEEIIEAVKTAFNDTTKKVDIRFLWTSDDVHRFRVNCWKDGAIQHSLIQNSEFVQVIEENGQLTVRRIDDKKK